MRSGGSEGREGGSEGGRRERGGVWRSEGLLGFAGVFIHL